MTEVRPDLTTPDIYELVDNVELVGVRFLEVLGRAKPEPEEDDKEPIVDIKVQEAHGTDNIGVRFRIEVDHPQAIYHVAIALSYKTQVEYEHDRAVLEDFIERVAIMTAFPYLREAVSTTAAKLELDVPILGILRQGDFSLGQPSEDLPDNDVPLPIED